MERISTLEYGPEVGLEPAIRGFVAEDFPFTPLHKSGLYHS